MRDRFNLKLLLPVWLGSVGALLGSVAASRRWPKPPDTARAAYLII